MNKPVIRKAYKVIAAAWGITANETKRLLIEDGFESSIDLTLIGIIGDERIWESADGLYFADYNDSQATLTTTDPTLAVEDFTPIEVYRAFRGIRVWEYSLGCSDCESGSETHNCFHHPYTDCTYTFNGDFPDEKNYGWCRLIDEWAESELTPETLDGMSWTQFAIHRCNCLS